MTTKITISETYYIEYGEKDLEDEWDREDETHEIEIHGIEVSDKYYHILVGYEIDPKAEYYLLYAVYSTGDSFHRENGLHEYIDLFRTEEEAKLAEAAFEKAPRNQDYIEYTSSCGITVPYRVPWNGYFESLNYIDVKKVEVLKA
jgi:hypothetical protein